MSPRWSRRRAASVGVLLAVLLAGCGGGAAGEPTAEPAEGDPGVVHAHGLGIDPADDSLYIATHTGLWRAEEGQEARRVGDGLHDLMGFTIAGAGDFLASGHPDLRVEHLQIEGKPPLLGLIRSADPAAGWQPVSLLGEVDFHALRAAHGRVYGWDSTSGRFMVSSDRRNWETRSTLGLLDFAVSPDDPAVVLAAAQEGAIRSGDGGRTWEQVASEPLVRLSWAEGELVAATADGRLVASDDEGRSWSQRGDLGGFAEALLVTDGEVLAFVEDTGVVASTDGGETWSVRVPAAAHDEG